MAVSDPECFGAQLRHSLGKPAFGGEHFSKLNEYVACLFRALIECFGLVAEVFHFSGVISTVVAGLTIGNYGRGKAMKAKTVEVVDMEQATYAKYASNKRSRFGRTAYKNKEINDDRI